MKSIAAGPLRPDGVTSWSWMSVLHLRCDLEGAPPEAVISWSSMSILKLDCGLFEGALPDAVGGWTSVRDLHFSNWKQPFSSPIPAGVASWRDIERIDVFGVFEGALPDAVGSWTAITVMHLDDNMLRGVVVGLDWEL